MKNTTILSIAAMFLAAVFFAQTANEVEAAAFETGFATCKVKNNNTDFFVTSTEKTIKLKKGTSLSWTIPDMHQGMIVVKAKVGKKWIQGEILLDDTTCN